MSIQQLFEGDTLHRGRLWSITPDGTKTASVEKLPFDWEQHFKGGEDVKNIQGLSPVNLDTGTVKWLGLDVDLKIKPKEFCGNVFSKLGSQYFCFRTTGDKWRVIEFFDEPVDVDVARDRAKELEVKMEKVVGYKCDHGHTLPQSYNLEEKKQGGWFYMPYCNDKTVCYSPEGFPLTKQQFEFRARYKHLPLVVASVGMAEGGRHKSFFAVALCNKHLEANVDLKELNVNFGEQLPDDRKLDSDITHAENQSEKYDKKYLLNGIPKWCEELCGVRLHLDAQGFGAVTKELTNQYIYVRERKSLYEVDTFKFIDREQCNDWWGHYTAQLPVKDRKPMTKILIDDPRLEKVMTYLCHAGKPSGVIELKDNEVKGLEGGKYLNDYKPSEVEAIKGDVTKLDEYWNFCLGEDNWLIVKQFLAFMLKEPGTKAQWFIIIQGKIQGIGKKLFSQMVQKMLGVRNVRANVSFKRLTSEHSTIVEGAQMIFLNEVSLSNNTGKRKELSEEFKDKITDDTLMVNPKGLPEIEIPNLCNFAVFSNSETPIYIDEDDRRAFVIMVSRDKEEVKHKLRTEGYHKVLIDAIEDPSAFKYHLINEVEYDRDMFFIDAPLNEDKLAMLKSNRGEFENLLDSQREEGRFPFHNLTLTNPRGEQIGERWIYKGLFNLNDLHRNLKAHPLFQKEYFGLLEVTDYLKSNCTLWPNGEHTKEIESNQGHRRIYLMEPKWTKKIDGEEIPLSRLTKGQLADLWDLEPGKEEDLNKVIMQLPNFQDPVFKDKVENKWEAKCWSCHTEIKLSPQTKCEECNYAIKCKCGMCACDKPGSKIKKTASGLEALASRRRQHEWDNRKNVNAKKYSVKNRSNY